MAAALVELIEGTGEKADPAEAESAFFVLHPAVYFTFFLKTKIIRIFILLLRAKIK